MPISQPTFGFQALATSTALNSMTLTFTTEINRIGGWVPAGTAPGGATSSGTAGTIPLRDANGGFNVSGLAVLVNNTTGAIGITGISGQTANYINIITNLGATVFAITAAGNATFGFGLTVTGTTTHNAAVTISAGGIAVTGASSVAGNFSVTGASSVLSATQISVTAPNTSTVPFTAIGADTASRRAFSAKTSDAVEHAFINTDGAFQLAVGVWTNYPGNMSSNSLFNAFAYPATPASLVVNVAPGSVWNGNAWIENPSGGSITYGGGGGNPALPITNPRIDIIGYNASNALAVVIGTEAVSPTPVALPAAFTPLAYIKVRPGATQIQALGTTDTGTQSYIYRDIRADYVNPTGLGASGTFAPLTSTYITDADETGTPGLVNAKRLGLVLAKAQTVSGPAGVAGPFGGPDLIRTGWTSNTVFDAALSTMMKNRVSYNLQSNPQKYLNKQSSTVWQLVGSGVGDAIAIDANGSWRIVATTLTVTVSGAAGVKYICADTVTGGFANGPGFGLTMLTSAPSANSGQIPLCAIYWTGTAIDDTMVDYSPLGVYTLNNDGSNREYSPYVVQQTSGTNTTISGTVGVVTNQTGLATTTLNFPRKCKCLISGYCRLSQGATPSAITTTFAVIQIDGSGAGLPLATITMPATGIWDEMTTFPLFAITDPVAGSSHTFTIGASINTSGISGAALPIILQSGYMVQVY